MEFSPKNQKRSKKNHVQMVKHDKAIFKKPKVRIKADKTASLTGLRTMVNTELLK